jgi:hypothetical protein
MTHAPQLAPNTDDDDDDEIHWEHEKRFLGAFAQILINIYAQHFLSIS